MSEPNQPQVKPFTLVRIPCDEAQAVCEERFTGNSEAGLREHLTRHFRRALLSEAQRKEMATHLVSKTKEQMEKATKATKPGENVEMDPEQQQQLIDAYLDQCGYEIVPVTMPMRDTGFIGTSLYIDDSGAFKDLPLNHRASKIAQRDIRGDAFLMSNHDDPALDEWGRVDCTLGVYEELYRNPPTSTYDTSNRAQMAQAAMLRENDTKRISPEDAAKALTSKEDGNRFFATGDTKAAIQAYSLAIELSEGRRDLLPNEAELTSVHTAALLNRSLCLAREGRPADAAKDARRVLLLDANNVKAHYRLAQASIALREYEGARVSVAEFARCGGGKEEVKEMLDAIAVGERKYREEQKKAFSKLFA